jgi:hypothetical protein
VLRLAEAGYVGVALLGAEASTTQLGMLAALGKSIRVAFDNDAAGREARDRFSKRKLKSGAQFTERPFYVPEPFKDLGEMDAASIRAAVTGLSLGPEELALLDESAPRTQLVVLTHADRRELVDAGTRLTEVGLGRAKRLASQARCPGMP